MELQYDEPYLATSDTNEESKEDVVFKHDKDGLSIYITIYNTNNNANEDGQAGLKQEAETGGQISGGGGQNANQGGQISGKCGQNANQDSDVSGKACGRAPDSAELQDEETVGCNEND